MKDRIDFYSTIRSIVTFISEEIGIIQTSQKTKETVLGICEAISSDVLSHIEKLMMKTEDRIKKLFDEIPSTYSAD